MGFQLNWVHLFLTSPVVPNAQTATVWLNRFQQDSEAGLSYITRPVFRPANDWSSNAILGEGCTFLYLHPQETIRRFMPERAWMAVANLHKRLGRFLDGSCGNAKHSVVASV